MRPIHPIELFALLLAAIPTAVFSIGCILPGCGGGPDAPERVLVDERLESSTTESTAETGAETGITDTSDPGEPSLCDASDPALSLWRLRDDVREPLGETIAFEYGGNCGSSPELVIDVAAAGLLPGPVEVHWQVDVDGQAPVEGERSWDLVCGPQGLHTSQLALDLPLEADGSAISIEITLMDIAGTEVSASHTFIARVTGR